MKFWRTIGVDKFDNRTYVLDGPHARLAVHSEVLRRKNQTVCFLGRGWSDFCRKNEVCTGDSLLFTQVDTFVFHVTHV